MVVGLVGKTCSGKNAAADYLVEKGFFEIDVDKLGHLSLEENHDRIVDAFGIAVSRDGKIDRKVLGPLVFSDPAKLEMLNDITHPWMVERVKAEISEHKNTLVNAALLESMGLVELCDEVLFVFAPKEIRMKRAMERDGISAEAFEKRNDNQANIGTTLFTNSKKVITIINDSSKESLNRQLDSYCHTLSAKGVL
jgi:dephospho-CoA kinase